MGPHHLLFALIENGERKRSIMVSQPFGEIFIVARLIVGQGDNNPFSLREGCRGPFGNDL